MFDFFKSIKCVTTYAYNIWSPKGLIDPFAYPVMRDYFPEQLKEIEGYTKAGATTYEAMKIFDDVKGRGQNKDIEWTSHEQWCWDRAKVIVRGLLGDWKVEPCSLAEAEEAMHLDKSAGYGYPGKKKGDVIDQVRAQATAMQYQAKDYQKIEPLPCMLGTRGHLHHYTEKKRRITYVVPAAQMMLEQMFVHPLYERAKSEKDYPIMIGENVIPRLSRMNAQEMSYRGSYSMELDISGFDKDLRTASLCAGFEIMEDMIDFDHWKGRRLGESEKKRWKRVWEYVVYYFLHTPVMLPDGRIEFLDGGVISGSGFTQFIESIVSMLYFVYTCLLLGKVWYSVMAVGDDCRGVVQGRPRIEDFAEVYLKTFHAVLNVEKTRVVACAGGGSQFLGYKFRNGFLYRDTMEWFKLMLYPENQVKHLQMSFSRLTAYMFLGGINDTMFTDFFTKYQTCYELENWDFEFSKDMKRKMLYGGMNFQIKGLLEYTAQDYLWGLISFKH